MYPRPWFPFFILIDKSGNRDLQVNPLNTKVMILKSKILRPPVSRVYSSQSRPVCHSLSYFYFNMDGVTVKSEEQSVSSVNGGPSSLTRTSGTSPSG